MLHHGQGSLQQTAEPFLANQHGFPDRRLARGCTTYAATFLQGSPDCSRRIAALQQLAERRRGTKGVLLHSCAVSTVFRLREKSTQSRGGHTTCSLCPCPTTPATGS